MTSRRRRDHRTELACQRDSTQRVLRSHAPSATGIDLIAFLDLDEGGPSAPDESEAAEWRIDNDSKEVFESLASERLADSSSRSS